MLNVRCVANLSLEGLLLSACDLDGGAAGDPAGRSLVSHDLDFLVYLSLLEL